MALDITPLRAFQDNYIWVLRRGDHAIAVDPGDATPVFQFLSATGLHLSEVWITHSHADHVGGVMPLKQAYPEVIIRGPSTGLHHAISHPCGEGDRVVTVVGDVDVWEIPGHTADHLAFILRTEAPEVPHVFCGDTLFGAGCGRVLGGTIEQLRSSLARFCSMPAGTLFFPAHEYTGANLRFAAAVEPTNPAVDLRAQQVSELRAAGHCSLPVSLSEELQTNPFLRTIVGAMRAGDLSESFKYRFHNTDLFSFLREEKNRF